MTRTILFALALPAFACHAIDGDRILAKDLAAANPAFASVDPELPVAPAPVPGAARIMHGLELMRFARANGVELAAPVADACFERASEPLTQEKLLPVLQKALGLDAATIEILDFIHTGIPRGSFEFSRAGLNASGLWRGQVMYAPSRSVPIWVKVRVTVERTWVEAARPIDAASVIDVSELVVRTGPRFPFGVTPIDSLDAVAGRAALRSIKPGEPIFKTMLTNPREVERGDTVAVVVTSGEARIGFDATAQSSGHTGESILIKNPENGRYFQARIEGKDKVVVKK